MDWDGRDTFESTLIRDKLEVVDRGTMDVDKKTREKERKTNLLEVTFINSIVLTHSSITSRRNRIIWGTTVVTYHHYNSQEWSAGHSTWRQLQRS